MLTRKLLLGAVAAGSLALPAAADAAAPGDLDPAFGGGAFTLDLTASGRYEVTDVAALPGGGAYVLLRDEVVRLRPDGAYDPTFAPLRPTLGGASAEPRDLALDAQGRLLIAGDAWKDGMWWAGVTRLAPDGALDRSFGDDGSAALHYAATSSGDHAASVVALPDGRVVLGGTHQTPVGQYDLGAARLTAAGEPDPAFAGDGTATLDVRQYDDAIAAVATPDGSVTVAGEAYSSGVPGAHVAARFAPDGTPDRAFDGDGAAVLALPGLATGEEADLNAFAVDAQGRLVAAGEVAARGDAGPNRGTTIVASRAVVARVTGAGRYDGSFGAGGVLSVAAAGGRATFDDVAVQPDGAIVAVGARVLDAATGNHTAFVARTTSDGRLDQGFAGAGTRDLAFGTGVVESGLAGVDLDREGRILVGGGMRPYKRYADRGGSPARTDRPAFARLVGRVPAGDPNPGDGGAGAGGSGPGAGGQDAQQPAPAPAPRPRPRAAAAPRVRLGRLARAPRTIAGTATGDVRRVDVAITRRSGKRCATLKTPRLRFKRASCARPTWLHAKGTARWSLALGGRLARGTYVVRVRVVGPGRAVLATATRTITVR